jgi:hypothetical protein
MELSDGVTINAKGGDTGDGGVITINNISTEEAAQYMDVSPGDNWTDDSGCSGTVCLRSSVSQNDEITPRSLALNGVTCQLQLHYKLAQGLLLLRD